MPAVVDTAGTDAFGRQQRRFFEEEGIGGPTAIRAPKE
jgi:hypothetical protein